MMVINIQQLYIAQVKLFLNKNKVFLSYFKEISILNPKL